MSANCGFWHAVEVPVACLTHMSPKKMSMSLSPKGMQGMMSGGRVARGSRCFQEQGGSGHRTTTPKLSSVLSQTKRHGTLLSSGYTIITTKPSSMSSTATCRNTLTNSTTTINSISSTTSSCSRSRICTEDIAT